MEIFISWHGPRGNAVAAALKDWLPQLVNAFNPWFSSSIDKGSRWRSEDATRLAKAKAGIIILTPSALKAPWLIFEAGAIAKSPEKTYACTLLIDLRPEDVGDPLSQFHHTAVTKEEFLKLVKTLNSALESEQMSEAHVEKAFEKWWSDLEKKLQNLPADEPTEPPHRDDRELLAEILQLGRDTSARVTELASQVADVYVRADLDPFGPSTTGRPGRLRALRDLLGTTPSTISNGTVFESPFVPASSSENLAAHTLLRNASQPDEVPPKRAHVIPRRRKT